jgi:O-glycosyl hydrolase
MRSTLSFAILLFSVSLARAQQIYDVWQTTWDRQQYFTYTKLSPPMNFGAKGTIGDADIVVTDSTQYQSVQGFGSTLTDSAALVLSQLKTKNSAAYWDLLKYMYDPTDGANSAGFTFLRISLGASDFSASVYSYDDSSGDTGLSKFTLNNAPSYLFATIKDIQSINSILKPYILPWSPPGWMKSGTMKGGSLQSQYVTSYANYLLKCVQGFNSKGILPYIISIQNEPQNSDSTYPSTSMSASQMGQIGTALRTLLNNNGFGSVRIVGYEHNWDNAATYPVQLMQSYGSAFSGVAFHCYGGGVSQQDSFHSKYPSKNMSQNVSSQTNCS